jgi:hypothetical protein
MSYSREMYRNVQLQDEYSRRVRDYALRQGERAFLERYLQVKQAEKEVVKPGWPKVVGYRQAADELLRTHPEYQDERGEYYTWFAYWYNAGFECQEDAKLQQFKEYIHWYY